MGKNKKAKKLINAIYVNGDGLTELRTDGRTVGRTDKAGYRVAVVAINTDWPVHTALAALIITYLGDGTDDSIVGSQLE